MKTRSRRVTPAVPRASSAPPMTTDIDAEFDPDPELELDVSQIRPTRFKRVRNRAIGTVPPPSPIPESQRAIKWPDEVGQPLSETHIVPCITIQFMPHQTSPTAAAAAATTTTAQSQARTPYKHSVVFEWQPPSSVSVTVLPEHQQQYSRREYDDDIIVCCSVM